MGAVCACAGTAPRGPACMGRTWILGRVMVSSLRLGRRRHMGCRGRGRQRALSRVLHREPTLASVWVSRGLGNDLIGWRVLRTCLFRALTSELPFWCDDAGNVRCRDGPLPFLASPPVDSPNHPQYRADYLHDRMCGGRGRHRIVPDLLPPEGVWQECGLV